jgi:hypothetical protein
MSTRRMGNRLITNPRRGVGRAANADFALILYRSTATNLNFFGFTEIYIEAASAEKRQFYEKGHR